MHARLHFSFALSIIPTLAVALAFFATPANAASDLTWLGCVREQPAADICASSLDVGLQGVADLAMSADGKSLYSVSHFGWLLVFNRDPATGFITPTDCFADNEASVGCAHELDTLERASAVAVSPDGASVYVVSRNDSTLQAFSRDQATGALTPVQCFQDATAGSGCIGGPIESLNYPLDVAVSEDNKSVYVTAQTSGSLRHFTRTPGATALSADQCFDVVGPPTTSCTLQSTLGGADSLTVSPDNKSVYVTSMAAHSLHRFTRNTGSGQLSFADCIEDPDKSTKLCGGGPGQVADGLTSAEAVAVSHDNKSLYVAGGGDDAVVRFDRDSSATPSNGSLTNPSCVIDEDAFSPTANCAQEMLGLDRPTALALADDDSVLYVTAYAEHAITSLARDTSTGALTPLGKLIHTQLAVPGSVVTAGDFVYVASGGDKSIHLFSRTGAGIPGGGSGGGGGGGGGGGNGAPVFPSNNFKLGKKIRPTRTGIGMAITVPGLGVLDVQVTARAGQGKAAASKKVKTIKVASKKLKVSAAGTVKVSMKFTSAAKKLLKKQGSLKAQLTVKFTPTGGVASTQTRTVTLKKT